MPSERDKTRQRRALPKTVKMRLQMVELSVVLFVMACFLVICLAIAPVVDRIPQVPGAVIWPFIGLAATIASMQGGRMLIRLCVAQGIITTDEARDFPRRLGRGIRGYAESWLAPQDDDPD